MCLGALLCGAARGDDIEIFLGTSDRSSLAPDILFVIDSSASMAAPTGAGETRLDAAVQIVTGLLDVLERVQVGLVYRGAGDEIVVLPPREIDAPVTAPDACDAAGPCTVRRELVARLQQLRPGGAVDVSALGIAALDSLRGARAPADAAAHDEASTRASCAPSDHLVVLTDGSGGEPREPSIDGRDPRVVTHVIDLGAGSRWLAELAAVGQGIYRALDTAATAGSPRLASELLLAPATFTGARPVAEHFTRMGHGRDVYFGIFQPDLRPRWQGNLKKYVLAQRGALVVDADGRAAIDPTTGFFAPGTRSVWSAVPDGAEISQGGASAMLPHHELRRVYTVLPGATPRLAAPANALHPANAALDPAAFGAESMTPADFRQHVEWLRGRDVDDDDADGDTWENRHAFGAPLHSRPAVAHYGGGDVEVFIGTNAGALHAIRGRTGVESFAFVPRELLPRQRALRANLPTTPHVYGIDGSPTVWVADPAGDGIDPSDARDFVRVYTGMRRGGRSYYALDVTSRGDPRLLWQLSGGEAGHRGDFRELGQTWSGLTKTRIQLRGETTPRDVLLFSAGYDAGQDAARSRRRDTVGRGMYIVDAITGELLWSGGKTGAQAWTRSFAEMDYAFPAAPAAIDVDGDGLLDMWFAADTGGRLWRFDVLDGAPLSDLIRGGIVGDLGAGAGGDSIVDNRRFFASPSVAIVRGPGGPELVIALGSGFRPSPLSVLARNRMHLLRQQDVFSAPSRYEAVSAAALRDVSDTAPGAPLPPVPVAAPGAGLPAEPGWYFDLQGAGEKALSSPLIVNDRVVFSTFTPGEGGTACQPAPGLSRAYELSLRDGRQLAVHRLFAPTIVDDPVLVVTAPPALSGENPDGGAAGDVDPEPGPPTPAQGACPDGTVMSVRLNAEARPFTEWCSELRRTYWERER